MSVGFDKEEEEVTHVEEMGKDEQHFLSQAAKVLADKKNIKTYIRKKKMEKTNSIFCRRLLRYWQIKIT